MQFKVSANFDYTVNNPSTIVLSHLVHHSKQKVLFENLELTPEIFNEEISIGPENNRLTRINMIEPGNVKISYQAQVQTAFSITDFSQIQDTSVSNINPEIFPYLYPSRYCQSDKLTRFAEHEFGSIENVFDKVAAITDWIYDHVEYLSGSTNVETSAYDTVTQQAGVCRDFAHLGIALCRVLTIPARYCAVYAYQLAPQDFHACFEAYLGDKWVMFDATRLAPLNGFVKIAMGRDASDTAVSNLFGEVEGNSIEVNCELLNGEFQPFYNDRNNLKGLVYDNYQLCTEPSGACSTG
jgi:transglutaminase-like putative cysteine protease